MKVLVNGIGNIGKTILGVLCDYKLLLGIEEIYALKNSEVADWNEPELNMLIEKGVIVCSKTDRRFKPIDEVIQYIDYIFDCNANTIGLKNKSWYESVPNLKGCSAQGSEKGFGVPYMSGVNNESIVHEKFVQIVSCNTHGIAAVISTLVNGNLSAFIEGDFVVVRRSEDIGNHQRLVSGNVLSRHLDESVGTHHAVDVKDLFETIGVDLHLQSSDITTPSQLMHAVRFSVLLKDATTLAHIREHIKENKSISSTQKFDSNVIFELGRRYSPQGRIFSHAIVNSNNLLFEEKSRRVKGWAFIPQEGNTILSSVHAFLLQTSNNEVESRISKMRSAIVRPEW